MPFIALGALAVSVAGSVAGGIARQNAAYAGASIVDQQADNQQSIVDEQLRRTRLQNNQIIGADTAAMNASGFQTKTGGLTDRFMPNSTTQQYLTQMGVEMSREYDFQAKEGELSVSLMRKRADLMRSGADAGLIGDIFGTAGSGLSSLGNIGKGLNWFGGGDGGGGGGGSTFVDPGNESAGLNLRN